jgi:hypothetical protein
MTDQKGKENKDPERKVFTANEGAQFNQWLLEKEMKYMAKIEKTKRMKLKKCEGCSNYVNPKFTVGCVFIACSPQCEPKPQQNTIPFSDEY